MEQAAMPPPTAPAFDAYAVRADFPCLHQAVNGQPLAFLDSAASAQKPQVVIDTLSRFYAGEYANVHRGMYYLSQNATRQFEESRQRVAMFLNAASSEEIIFTKGATEGINLVAQSYGGSVLQEGDEILISAMEHHANIVPWQQIAKQRGARLVIAPLTDDGALDMDAYHALLSERTRIVALLHMSNALGTIVPMKEVITAAHNAGAAVLVDACQSIVHMTLDVTGLDADFLVFSGHKLYGPTGIGVLYGKRHLLESMPPYQTGGEMVDTVTFEHTSFAEPPLRFEAGTPPIAEAIALHAAIDYITGIDRDAARDYENRLLREATEAIDRLPHFTIIGRAPEKASVISLVHEQAHGSDIGMILDKCGVAMRTGHHCAQPLMQRLGITGTARASFAIYNTEADVEALLRGLHKVNKLLG